MAQDSVANSESKPKVTVELQIEDQSAFLKAMGGKALAASDFEGRFSSWDYHWYCNVFNTCETTYNGGLFVVRMNDGIIVRWNLMESATKKDHGIPYGASSPNYRKAENAQYCPFGFGTQDGKTQDVSTAVTCYANWGRLEFRWDASCT